MLTIALSVSEILHQRGPALYLNLRQTRKHELELTNIMASLTTFPGNRYWYAVFRDAAGKQHCYTTGVEHSPPGATRQQRTHLKQEAFIIAIELERAERGPKCLRVLKKRYGLVADRMKGVAHSIVPISVYLRAWVANKANSDYSGVYLGTLSRETEAFITAIGDSRAANPISSVVSADIQTYRESLIARPVGKSTQNAYVHILREAFGDAELDGSVFVSPVEIDKHFYEDPEAFTHKPLIGEPLTQLLKVTQHLQWRLAIHFGFYCAMRLGDATTQRWGNINWEQQIISWVPEKTKRYQPGPVKLPIHDKLFELLKSLPRGADDEYITRDLGNYTRPSRSRIFMAMLRDAGIDPEYLTGGSGKPFPQISFHSLRHGSATLLDAAGVPKERNKWITAHETDKSHDVYVHRVLLMLKTDIAMLPNIG